MHEQTTFPTLPGSRLAQTSEVGPTPGCARLDSHPRQSPARMVVKQCQWGEVDNENGSGSGCDCSGTSRGFPPGTAASSSWRTLGKQLRGGGKKTFHRNNQHARPTPLGLIRVDIKSTKRIFHKICTRTKKKSLALIDGARETFCLCLCSVSQRCSPFLLNNAQGYWSSDLSSIRSASLHRLPRAHPYLLQWCMSWCSTQPERGWSLSGESWKSGSDPQAHFLNSATL